MKLPIITVIISALLLLYVQASAFALSMAPDTIPGQYYLTRQITSEVCRLLDAEQQRSPVAAMSNIQAQETFERALSAGIEKQVPSIKQLARRSKTPNAYEKLRKDIPTAVALALVKTCPAATTLYNRFSRSVANSSEAEKAFFDSWGDELCQKLNILNAQGLMQEKTSAERMELFHQEYTAALSTRGPQIMQLYGPAGNSPEVVEALGNRLTESMVRPCPNTLLLLKPTK